MIVWTTRYGAYPILDRQWDQDRDWKRELVRRLRKGEVAPRGVSVYDVFPSESGFVADSWEMAEKVAANANRIHSAYLTDKAIAARSSRRQALKEAMAEAMAESAAKTARDKARRAEEAAARAEAYRAEEARQIEQERRRAESLEAWQREEERLKAERAERHAAWKREGERQRILRKRWEHAQCENAPAFVKAQGDGYVFKCTKCLSESFAEHERVWKVVVNEPS